jgi:glycosyltransferase involved in cell wall biosynthesis
MLMSDTKSNTVVFISGSHVWSMGPGRGASSFYRTIQHYHDAGWNVVLISNNDTRGLGLANLRIVHIHLGPLTKLMSLPKIGHLFKLAHYFLFTASAILSFLKIRKSLCQRRVIVYAYEIQGVMGAYALNKLWKVPSVHRFQGTVLKPLMNLPFWKVRFWDHYLGLSLPASLTIMTDDGTMGDEVLDRLRPSQRYEFWRNGVNLNYPAHQWYSKGPVSGNAPLQLLAVSRLVGWKRVDRLIHAVAMVSKQYPNLTLRILGDGPERDPLQRLAKDLQITNNILFTGAVPQAEVEHYMTTSDIFLSVYSLSNLGNPLFEALCAGLPIVTINNGDTNKVIEHEVNGILLDDDSIESIAAAIENLINDPDLRYRLAHQARAYANRTFVSWESRLATEEAVVRQMLGS